MEIRCTITYLWPHSIGRPLSFGNPVLLSFKGYYPSVSCDLDETVTEMIQVSHCGAVHKTLSGPLEPFEENMHAYILGEESLFPSKVAHAKKYVSSGVTGISLSYT